MIVHPMQQYHDLVTTAMMQQTRQDRTGTGCRSFFGATVVFDHRKPGNFPYLTTKKLNFRAVVAELLWFLSGSTNIGDLDARIWDQWADENGDVGPVYGHQWRHWTGFHGKPIDQVANLIEGLRNDPYSRRHIVSAWNVDDLPDMRLAPCHYAFQCYTESDGTLSIKVQQRSADLMLGVPFNLASYSLLLHMLAQCVDRKPGRHIHDFGDVHLYENHVEGAREMVSRSHYQSPEIRINPEITDIFEFGPDDIKVGPHETHPAIHLPIAV